MYQVILIFHVVIACALIGLVLLQPSQGGMGAMGSGASQTVFGSQGATSFLFKLTAWIAAIFFATSMTLTYLVSKQHHTEAASNLGFTVPTKSLETPVEKTNQQPPVPIDIQRGQNGKNTTGSKNKLDTQPKSR